MSGSGRLKAKPSGSSETLTGHPCWVTTTDTPMLRTRSRDCPASLVPDRTLARARQLPVSVLQSLVVQAMQDSCLASVPAELARRHIQLCQQMANLGFLWPCWQWPFVPQHSFWFHLIDFSSGPICITLQQAPVTAGYAPPLRIFVGNMTLRCTFCPANFEVERRCL